MVFQFLSWEDPLEKEYTTHSSVLGLPSWLSWWAICLQCRRPGFDLGLGRSPGEGEGYPLQYSGMENSMDCIIHGVAKSQTQLSDFNLEYSQSCTLNLQSNFRTVSLPQRKSVPNSSHSSTPLFLSPLQLLIYFVFVNFTIPFHINGIIYYVVIYISHFSLSRIFSRLYVNSMYQYFFFHLFLLVGG